MTPEPEKKRFYEAVRQSDVFNPSKASEEMLEDFLQDRNPSNKQKELVADRLAEEERVNWNVDDNVVSTDNRADIPEDNVRRDSSDHGTYVETSKGEVRLDNVSGTFENQGTKFVMVDGKIYGALK